MNDEKRMTGTGGVRKFFKSEYTVRKRRRVVLQKKWTETGNVKISSKTDFVKRKQKEKGRKPQHFRNR